MTIPRVFGTFAKAKYNFGCQMQQNGIAIKCLVGIVCVDAQPPTNCNVIKNFFKHIKIHQAINSNAVAHLKNKRAMHSLNRILHTKMPTTVPGCAFISKCIT